MPAERATRRRLVCAGRSALQISCKLARRDKSIFIEICSPTVKSLKHVMHKNTVTARAVILNLLILTPSSNNLTSGSPRQFLYVIWDAAWYFTSPQCEYSAIAGVHEKK